MRNDRVHWGRPLAAAMVLVLWVAVASFWVTEQVNRQEEQASFTSLAEEADKLARSIEERVDSDREKLTLLAEILAMGEEAPAEYLALYQDTGSFFSRLELLLPGDRVVTADGEEVSAAGRLSFAQEAARGAHVTDRETDLDGQSPVVRHYVPVVRQGQTAALLCGVIELRSLAQELPYQPYGGQTAVYLIDGATGDFLVDTWHTGQQPGNIWALGSRPMAEGYNDAQLRQGLVNGESNFVVFRSQTTGEYLYFYYTPLAVNQWRVALSVPEHLVFARAQYVRSLLDRMLAAEGAAFLLYLCWVLYYIRREMREMERQGWEDALTGLYNRNRYQHDLPILAQEGRRELCCIFVDVNGLHELNNTQGHQTGDRMLQEVARQIRQDFGTQWSYRVGGDEFVIFAVDRDREEILRRTRTATRELERKGYYISAGVAWTPAPARDLAPLLQAAEQRMYEAKRSFYQNAAFDRRAR